jgi:hypothetical protein
MTAREWTCFQCGSRWATDSTGELIESALVASPCLGCKRLGPILQESARKRAEIPVEPEPEQVLTQEAILSRLLAGRSRGDLPVDFMRRAANDED